MSSKSLKLLIKSRLLKLPLENSHYELSSLDVITRPFGLEICLFSYYYRNVATVPPGAGGSL